ncbi:MAG: hypothetical protein ACOX2F_01500 [bacterium]
MKVLVTVWNGRISPVFDVAREGLLLDVENGEVISKKSVLIDFGTCMDKVNFILRERIDLLICGAISRRVEVELVAKGVVLYPFISGEIDDVIRGFIENRLENQAFAMPGCRRGEGRGRRRKRLF